MRTVLIIGAGSNVGQATAEAFEGAGYAVAVASRTSKLGPQFKHFNFDASQPDTVQDLFANVRKTVGIPGVVIFNAYSDHISSPDTPFDLPVDVFTTDLHVNATSPWLAAGEAVRGFEDLGDALGPQGGTFIFTGNILNDTAAPGFLTFGMGKSAAAHLIKHLALVAYGDKPYKFYYPDQRHPDGAPVPVGLSGAAHAALYVALAEDPTQRPWQQTFVEGKEYVAFPKQDAWVPISQG